MGRKIYEGEEITVSFDMKRCIHARNCFLKLPEVFDPAQRPWVQPDSATAEEIAATIRTCPSGALAFERKDGPEEQPPKINRIAVTENGPLEAAGKLHVEGESETRVALCRCGLSKNKPYCDYSHVEGGFKATGEPRPDVAKESDDRGGEAVFSRVPDGPLKVSGEVELTTGTGAKIAAMSQAFLCRCGASQNKPFCDGSHKRIGFSDPSDS